MPTYERITSAGGTGSSGSATFPSEPLPAGYVLVAFHARNQGSEIPTPAGWTKVGEDDTVATRRMAIFVRRSDGTVNSITNTGSNVTWTTILIAYEQSEEDMADGWTGFCTADFVSSLAAPELTPTGYGVTVAFLRASSAVTGRTWGGGLEEQIASGNQFVIAERLGDTPITPSVSWTSGAIQNSNLAAVHIPLEPPPPPPLEKIPLTVSRLSSTSVNVAWTHPDDAPDGITIVRAPGVHVNDGDDRAPDDEEYDPLTVADATVIAEGEGSSPYVDSGLTPGEYTYWVVRTGA